jgi:multiple sugar transport system ATP-binding protein
MTIRENLEFGLRMRKTPRAEMDRLVQEAAGILGMTDVLSRKPAQLSGGQRQRVALGRALVRHPAVFLFDEPLSNLDAKLRVQMRAEIKKLQQRLGTTAIYVTHDQIEAMTMGARIAVMRAGRIQQVGAPLEIYQRPVNLFVANFIGTPPMNFLRARLEGGGVASLATGVRLRFRPKPPAGAGGRPAGRVGFVRERRGRREASEGPTVSLPSRSISWSPWETKSSCAASREEALLCKLAPTRVPAAGGRLVVAISFRGCTSSTRKPSSA